MKKIFLFFFPIQFVFFAIHTSAQNPEIPAEDTISIDSFLFQNFIDSVEASMNFQTGSVIISGNLATLNVPEGYKYLNPEQSEYVLTDLWGNPPSPSLGLLFPDTCGGL